MVVEASPFLSPLLWGSSHRMVLHNATKQQIAQPTLPFDLLWFCKQLGHSFSKPSPCLYTKTLGAALAHHNCNTGSQVLNPKNDLFSHGTGVRTIQNTCTAIRVTISFWPAAQCEWVGAEAFQLLQARTEGISHRGFNEQTNFGCFPHCGNASVSCLWCATSLINRVTLPWGVVELVLASPQRHPCACTRLFPACNEHCGRGGCSWYQRGRACRQL